jgi:hypothetical protein
VEVSPVLLAVLATPTRITPHNPLRLSSVGTDSVKSPSPDSSSTPDVTRLIENLYISNIIVEWVVLMHCIMEISGSSLKLETSYTDRPSFLISLFLSSPTSGGRSVGMVRWRAKAPEFVCLFVVCQVNSTIV